MRYLTQHFGEKTVPWETNAEQPKKAAQKKVRRGAEQTPRGALRIGRTCAWGVSGFVW